MLVGRNTARGIPRRTFDIRTELQHSAASRLREFKDGMRCLCSLWLMDGRSGSEAPFFGIRGAEDQSRSSALFAVLAARTVLSSWFCAVFLRQRKMRARSSRMTMTETERAMPTASSSLSRK